MNAKASDRQQDIRVIEAAKCRSLSGKSTLTYEIGASPDSRIHFRVVGNTAAGAFAQEWISLDAVKKAFSESPGPKAITAHRLLRVIEARGQNTPAFLLAALKAERLVKPSTEKRRCHEAADDAVFEAAIKAWLSSEEKAADGKPAGKQSAGARTKHVTSNGAVGPAAVEAATVSAEKDVSLSKPEVGAADSKRKDARTTTPKKPSSSKKK